MRKKKTDESEILGCENCSVFSKTFFKHISEKDTSLLSDNRKCSLYKKGENIFKAGATPIGIYCLNKGKVKIYRTGNDVKEQIVRFVMPGDLLGLRALIGERSYSASATALEDCVVCFINKHDFFELAKKYPEVSYLTMKTLSRLLEEAESKIISLAQKHVRERLAETLVILNKIFKADNNTIILSREDLANIVGTANETVIRLLSEFKDEKLVAVKGRKITLLNVDGLKRRGGIID